VAFNLCLFNASQFGFRACLGTTLLSMRPADQVTLNLNNNKNMAAVFLDIEKPLILHATLACFVDHLNWNFRPVYPSSCYFLSQKKFRISVGGEMSAPMEIQARLPQGFVMFPTL
jgi:hypothetical protein